MVVVRHGEDWVCDVLAGPDAVLALPEIALALPLSELYADLALTAAAEPPTDPPPPPAP